MLISPKCQECIMKNCGFHNPSYRTNAKPAEPKPKRDFSALWRLSHVLFFPIVLVIPVVFVLFLITLPLIITINYIFQFKRFPDPVGLTLDYIRIWFSNGIKPGTRTVAFWNRHYRDGYWYRSHIEWNEREARRAERSPGYKPKHYSE